MTWVQRHPSRSLPATQTRKVQSGPRDRRQRRSRSASLCTMQGAKQSSAVEKSVWGISMPRFVLPWTESPRNANDLLPEPAQLESVVPDTTVQSGWYFLVFLWRRVDGARRSYLDGFHDGTRHMGTAALGSPRLQVEFGPPGRRAALCSKPTIRGNPGSTPETAWLVGTLILVAS